ncbi:MAG: hypothetical protein COX81_01990 [Candidatus Magasanikbacteria bacterium CG_4_10_14_0_2_um_filter_37_12]|uniref:Uncharacterized protein n=1 Tax=Candidatus Magasanikbacteria bacterium CG_4_10_14_0_2_um_filter_37_12 TaxID=1974637 RepID=A0A2M7V8I1_9BACT|nr:MAG: hypothetical protein COX81_01990 [Candidatus Magasanikbacteria bacterium CG_4_10_14_0_2_um_filter_37_12]
MLFFQKNKDIEEHLLFLLRKGPMKITDVITSIQKVRPKTTKQGVYYIIHSLKKDEVLVTHKKMVSLNAVWLKELVFFVDSAEHVYLTATTHSGHFLHLQDGEKIQYNFTNSLLTDAFWNHAIFQIEVITGGQEPFIAYNPHSWFFIAHPENEIKVRDLFVNNKRQYFVLSCHKKPFDLDIRHYFDGEWSQYYAQENILFGRENYYVNIIGDFIIEVWIDKKVAQRIDEFYTTYTKLREKEKGVFKHIIEGRGKTKLVISRDSKKASKFKKQFIKPFWVMT